MSRPPEAYLPADKPNRAMLAAAICVFLRITAYRRGLMRNEGLLFQLPKHPISDAASAHNSACIFSVLSALCWAETQTGVQLLREYRITRADFTTNEA